jgi:hypothetical protein
MVQESTDTSKIFRIILKSYFRTFSKNFQDALQRKFVFMFLHRRKKNRKVIFVKHFGLPAKFAHESLAIFGSDDSDTQIKPMRRYTNRAR